MDHTVSQKIEQFFGSYRTQSFSKGHILIAAGDEPPGVFHLVSGEVRQYDINERGDEIVVNVFQAPAFFPMSWAINRTPNRYFFQASQATTLQLAPPEEVVTFVRAHPDVMYDLLQRIYSGTDGMQRRMAHLMGSNAHGRILFEIIVECKRFGTKQPDGSYILPIHEDELARRAGLSRETTNRELMKLKATKLLDITHKELLVHDLAKLEETLGTRL